MKARPVKGMRDFYPDQMAVQNWLTGIWREVAQRHGFEEYDSPILEHLELYKAKSGDEMVEQIFHLADRGGRELAVRPETTPSLARMIGARASSLPPAVNTRYGRYLPTVLTIFRATGPAGFLPSRSSTRDAARAWVLRTCCGNSDCVRAGHTHVTCTP